MRADTHRSAGTTTTMQQSQCHGSTAAEANQIHKCKLKCQRTHAHCTVQSNPATTSSAIQSQSRSKCVQASHTHQWELATVQANTRQVKAVFVDPCHAVHAPNGKLMMTIIRLASLGKLNPLNDLSPTEPPSKEGSVPPPQLGRLCNNQHFGCADCTRGAAACPNNTQPLLSSKPAPDTWAR